MFYSHSVSSQLPEEQLDQILLDTQKKWIKSVDWVKIL